MATIIFDDNFSKDERVILSKTFKANCKALGLTEKDFTVQVKKKRIGDPGHYGRVNHTDKDLFLVELNSAGYNLFDATSCLGHEAVHMKQHLDGRMIDHPDGILWCGRLYGEKLTANRLFYKDLPWEKEAWDKQGPLHAHALCSLTKEERKRIDPNESFGLYRLLDRVLKGLKGGKHESN